MIDEIPEEILGVYIDSIKDLYQCRGLYSQEAFDHLVKQGVKRILMEGYVIGLRDAKLAKSAQQTTPNPPLTIAEALCATKPLKVVWLVYNRGEAPSNIVSFHKGNCGWWGIKPALKIYDCINKYGKAYAHNPLEVPPTSRKEAK